MHQIKVFIAEDTKAARDLITEGLNSYTEEIRKDVSFLIDKTENADKAINKLNESRKTKSYYDIFFCDIDFTEAGGRRDDGYKIIEKAFEICPLTKICTYSGQFHAKDLWPKYEELMQKGLIVNTMDKSHSEGGESDWLYRNINNLVDKVIAEKILFELWRNHVEICERVKENADIENLSKLFEINDNLETIIFLLLKRKDFNADTILFRLILQLYHRSLEIFVTGNKSEEQIVKESDENKENVFRLVEDLIKNEGDKEFKDKKSFLRKIAAHSSIDFYRYGHILNWYRNGSVHHKEKFTPELINVLYANLVMSLYVLEKNLSCINIDEIRKIINSKGTLNQIAQRDIKELIECIEDLK